MFPTIRHIDDVLPAIAGRPEFVVGKRDGYQFIDYNYVQSDSFDCPIRRECRGLKFDMAGNLIARPLHKFFNLHERPQDIPDFTQDHVVMEKLDGSMIHPAMVNGELVFMTRAGATEHARMAMEACKRLPYGRDILGLCHHLISNRMTPVFEYTSPANQIVVRYAEEAVTLLAVRDNEQGFYLQQRVISGSSVLWGVPSVRTFGRSAHDLAEFIRCARLLEDTEGYVIRCGQWLGKMKADAYVASHRARSGLLHEKDVLKLVLENKVDDLIGMIPKEEADRLFAWGNKLNTAVAMEAAMLKNVTTHLTTETRKEFAFAVSRYFKDKPYYASMCFGIYDGRQESDVVREHGLKQSSSTAKARTFLSSLGVEPWTATPVDLEG